MWLLVGDLHLTDQIKDQYRFGIFDWLAKKQEQAGTCATFLAGDITEAKDRHPAQLVNKIVEGLLKLRPPVYIDAGNHDYRDPKNPFFKFLSYIEGIEFVKEPKVVMAERAMGIIPHCRTQNEFDAGVEKCGRAAALLVHQTFNGAIAETGARLSGLSAASLEALRFPLGVYAGDVHRPQTHGIVNYIGCPYHVRFGDFYNPRVLNVLYHGRYQEFRFAAPYKWNATVTTVNEILHGALEKGDQIKLTIKISPEDVVHWKDIKARYMKACRQVHVDVHGVKMEVKGAIPNVDIRAVSGQTADAAYEDFCKIENVPSNIKEVGKKLIED